MGDNLNEISRSEGAVLVGLRLTRVDDWDFEESMRELAALTRTAGAKVLATLTQKASRPHPATFIGRGKVGELETLVAELGADMVIFDHELSPAQQRNVEEACECMVLDRTQLIMDIFARHASSREGHLQVELAQLRYLLPRLRGRGEMLSRLGAGIGTRGPGETKLEVDQRRIRDRISRLEDRLVQLEEQRRIQRSRRNLQGLPQISLVGYTNAGKSTLLNRIAGARVETRNSLFVTLDSTTRRLELPSGQRVLLSDTVGFIDRLPHHLVAAFEATLEEVRRSDIILHVIDSSHPRRERQKKAVLGVLSDLDALDKPFISAYNKIDLCRNRDAVGREAEKEGRGVAISALNGDGLDDLLRTIEDTVRKNRHRVHLFLPYERGDILDRLYTLGQVSDVKYEPGGIAVTASLEEELARQYSDFIH